MIQNSMINQNIIKNNVSLYFAEYIPENVNNNYTCFESRIFNKEILSNFDPKFITQFQKNYEELSKNKWELHKQLKKEGVNPIELAQIIRDDEVEKLQEISSQSNFDFNQIIEPSLYERCSFINKENVTLIDYAAFFSSVKCFKYLLMNGASVEKTGKYAVGGGNEEIIHLCEQNHSSFEYAYETVIEFHRNDIFKYLYENEIAVINNLEEIGKNVFLYCNFDILSFLFEKGMKVNENIIITSINTGNLYIVQYFLESNPIPIDFLKISGFSGNMELLNFLIKNEYINLKR